MLEHPFARVSVHVQVERRKVDRDSPLSERYHRRDMMLAWRLSQWQYLVGNLERLPFCLPDGSVSPWRPEKSKRNTTLTPRDCLFGVDFRDIDHYARTQHNLSEAGCVYALGDRVHGCRRVKCPGPLRDGLGLIVKDVATIELALIIALILPHASATFRALNPSGVTRSSGGSSKTRVKKTIRRKYPRRRGSSTRPA